MQNKQNTKRQTLIELHSINVNFETFKALQDVSLSIQKGDRIGLVGSNGAGKSTLLKALAGKIIVDSGSIKKSNDISIGYLPQITLDDDRIDSERSGGEKTKLILSKIFAEQHEVYLLDEPTNNLDAEGLDWLKKEISKPSNKASAFVIVSHDREFLDETINKIVQIDELMRTTRQFDCSYSEYRELIKKELEEQWKKYVDATEEKDRLKKTTDQRSEWIRKIEKKRADNRKLDPGEKEKPRAAYLRDKEAAMGQRTKAIRKRLDRTAENLALLPKPKRKLPINLSFDEIERSGEKVFTLKGVTYMYSEKKRPIGPITVDIKYGERIHISGNNGSGKTTLIRILLSELKQTSGEIQMGSRVRIGYLPQEELRSVKENIINAVCRILGVVHDDKQEGIFRRTLKRFGFEDSDSKKTIDQLSSGEHSRLQLALMKMMRPNCIILDEPTNHLDIEAVEALEKALKEFKGTLIVVSHDKRFVKEVRLTTSLSIS